MSMFPEDTTGVKTLAQVRTASRPESRNPTRPNLILRPEFKALNSGCLNMHSIHTAGVQGGTMPPAQPLFLPGGETQKRAVTTLPLRLLQKRGPQFPVTPTVVKNALSPHHAVLTLPSLGRAKGRRHVSTPRRC